MSKFPANLKVAELKVELANRNLPTKGLKKELTDRLEAALLLEQQQNAAGSDSLQPSTAVPEAPTVSNDDDKSDKDKDAAESVIHVEFQKAPAENTTTDAKNDMPQAAGQEDDHLTATPSKHDDAGPTTDVQMHAPSNADSAIPAVDLAPATPKHAKTPSKKEAKRAKVIKQEVEAAATPPTEVLEPAVQEAPLPLPSKEEPMAEMIKPETKVTTDTMEIDENIDEKKRKRDEEDEERNAQSTGLEPPNNPPASPLEPSPRIPPAKKLRRFNPANSTANAATHNSGNSKGPKNLKTEEEEEDTASVDTESLKASSNKIIQTDESVVTSLPTSAAAANIHPDEKTQELAPATEAKDERTVGNEQANPDNSNAGSVLSPNREPTNSIYIKGFVRPLTAQQVKRLVEQYGEVEQLWIDNIKTHCYVRYTTSAAAEAARAAIHDIKFPADTGRQLHVGLVLSDLVARMIPEEERALQERRKIDWEAMLLSGGPETRDEDQEEKEIDFSTVPTEPAAMRERGRLGGNPLGLVQKQLQKAAAAAPHASAPHTAAALNPASMSTSVPAPPKVKVLSLDDLFRKTEARPHLYYLPVATPEAKRRIERMMADRDRLRGKKTKDGGR